MVRIPGITTCFAHLRPAAVKGGFARIGAFLPRMGPAAGARSLARVETSEGADTENTKPRKIPPPSRSERVEAVSQPL